MFDQRYRRLEQGADALTQKIMDADSLPRSVAPTLVVHQFACHASHLGASVNGHKARGHRGFAAVARGGPFLQFRFRMARGFADRADPFGPVPFDKAARDVKPAIDIERTDQRLDHIAQDVGAASAAIVARPDDQQGLALLAKNEASLGNFIAARKDRANDASIQKLVKALHTPEVKKFIEEKYKGAIKPAF